jgi:hypothetical protein
MVPAFLGSAKRLPKEYSGDLKEVSHVIERN